MGVSEPGAERTRPDGDVQAGADAGAGGQAAGDATAAPAAEGGGAEAAREALNRARAAAKARGLAPGRPSRGALGAARREGARRRSGSGPDARDPQPFAAAIARLVEEKGWQTPVAVGGAIGRWDSVVGPDIAAHCRPDSYVDGVLTVVADSTAWATQVRMLVPGLLRRLEEELGEGTVTKIVVRGPSGPSWRRGPRVAPGSKGPGDTYG